MTLMHRTAINPLPWILRDGGYRLDRGVLGEAMTAVSQVGFTHLTIELPPETTAAEYGALLAEHSLAAAPGYFSAPFHDPQRHGQAVEAIKRHAQAHLELGVDSAFIAADLLPDRMAHPAIGTGYDRDRTLVVADGLAAAAEAAAAEGVRYGLHPHVGSAVEVEDEVRAVLDATAGSALWFGPDTGHLRWAGATPEKVIADYADRVLNVHVKDVDANAAKAARERDEDYWTATGRSKVWSEPGRGAIDFDAVLAALPNGFDGWFVIEVDVPNLPTPTESSAASLEFLRRHPYFTTTAAEES
ncbi:inosose dehydratase [Amycolatopsis mediterranei S699]|uniref:Inosose dehydratase n=2 Tax=Amycolatopsis mediterranei TaxID=33910 RepID=A0A0H3DFI0_AMYMU|nr:sugar phosphate isomerase/epimerase [Amycolatopsis mediterranei]ADJ48967.1 inosose dehydratase [Amycolatopsis mediterranei U32]AFO80675.1 inosose dehydratase [Amycolatopsis mediterranei S699]AGT87803.1 inosose dehydratase [Amycolatopsis mediterranei RB]KDU93915.1 inosose dehydratase [Amycolatopsis mediterranei]UZF74001.1 sugar phosphate isomerase/epimerase [Amycolatopsis mediterranei]